VCEPTVNCALLADRHPSLTEGMRDLLKTRFEAVVMVADETSLLESAERLQPALAIVDLALVRGDDLRWLRRLHARCPTLKFIVLSVHDEPSVRRVALEMGADGFVLKRDLAADLLPTVESVLAGQRPPPKKGCLCPDNT
jgi:two-component system secretion response regulator SsrB